jgi:hypothetical protein
MEKIETKENMTVQLTNPMQYDRLHTLAVEYSVSADFLFSEAVERLLSDVEFVRKLRQASWEK